MVALTSRTIQLLLLGLVIFANILRNRFNAWVDPGEKNAGISSWMRHEELPPEVLGAEHYLVGLDIPDDIAEEGDYKGVQVSFCALNWAPQKAAPNTVPRYGDIIRRSFKICNTTKDIYYDMNFVVRRLKEYDEANPDKVHALEESGFVFHESRCGSTLLSNMLVVSDPEGHRVYSEPLSLVKAMASQNKKLVEDVLYLMRRSSNPKEKRVFYKPRSTCVRNIHTMPEGSPWVFLYREPDAVVASHFHPSETEGVICLQSKGHPHPLEKAIAHEHKKKYKALKDAEVCAVRLASLTRSALREFERTGHGGVFNYNTLPASAWESILPDYFGVELNEKMIENMKVISGTYSKAAYVENRGEWVDDTSKKLSEVNEEQKKAANEYLMPDYEALEAIAAHQWLSRNSLNYL